MLSSIKIDREKQVHSRDMKIATFAHDDEHIIVEGELNDNSQISNFTLRGDVLPPRNIHHMIIRLLIEADSARIVKAEVEMPCIPKEDCSETIQTFARIEGLRIAPGFTAKVRKIFEGSNGCVHLTGLLMAMASAAFQGLWTYRGKERQEEEDIIAMVKAYLVGSCHAWRRDGPLVAELAKDFDIL
jgi:Protein of unknown function (DUF2889)